MALPFFRDIWARIASRLGIKAAGRVPWECRGEDNGIRIADVRRLWGGTSYHSAFTDLIRHQERWWCAFREASTHMSLDGVFRILSSSDGVKWKTAAVLKSADEDLRDPKFSVAPDGRLMLVGVGTTRKPHLHDHQVYLSYIWFSTDGCSWGKALPVADPDYWMWRATWHKGVCYGIGYFCAVPLGVRLYRSDDGRQFETLVESLFNQGEPNEHALTFMPDDTALCLLRCNRYHGLFGTAKPPYTEWQWKDTGMFIGGPDMLQLPDSRVIAAVRLYTGQLRTSLCWLGPATGRLDECLALPSGGDTSYPGLVWHEGQLWVSYYSSHEGYSAIYLATVMIDGL